LFLGLVLWRHHAAHPRVAAHATALSQPLTPFQTSFARAQQWYLRAQVITRQQLEALEEWDGAALRGSAAEIYRRSLIARTRETGLAEAAAREATGRAETNEESYRASRLLVYIECDLGHPQAELEQAKKLMALQPHNPEALLLLQRAAECNGQTGPARRAEELARTPDEQHRVAELLSRSECEAGRHELELQFARSMFRLRPRSDAARIVLRRAVRHNAGR
jgi:hypothetical protein